MRKVLISFIAILFVLAGCNSKEDVGKPEEKVEETVTKLQKMEVMTAYYNYIIQGDFEKAYDLLSEKTMERVDLEEYVLWQTLMTEKEDLLSAEVQVTNDDNVFQVIEEFEDYYSGEVLTATSERSVVIENGEVKIYRDDIDTNAAIADAYTTIGLMYADGQGKTQDLVLAEATLNKALEYNAEDGYTHLNLGYVHFKNGLYDQALLSYNEALSYLEDDDFATISLVISNIGAVYYDLEDFETAKEFYMDALEIDSENQLAKENLELLE